MAIMQGAFVNTVLFIGRPGSGKETQSKLLSEKTGFKIFSTGQRLREIREQDDALGIRVREAYDSAKLLPPWLAVYLFQEALFHLASSEGIIFEGSGRTREEAEKLHEIATWVGREYRVVNLDVPEEEARRRQVERARVQNRPESNTEEKITIRFDEYERHTAPALAFFREQGVVVDVPAQGSVADIHAEVLRKLGVS